MNAHATIVSEEPREKALRFRDRESMPHEIEHDPPVIEDVEAEEAVHDYHRARQRRNLQRGADARAHPQLSNFDEGLRLAADDSLHEHPAAARQRESRGDVVREDG